MLPCLRLRPAEIKVGLLHSAAAAAHRHTLASSACAAATSSCTLQIVAGKNPEQIRIGGGRLDWDKISFSLSCCRWHSFITHRLSVGPPEGRYQTRSSHSVIMIKKSSDAPLLQLFTIASAFPFWASFPRYLCSDKADASTLFAVHLSGGPVCVPLSARKRILLRSSWGMGGTEVRKNGGSRKGGPKHRPLWWPDCDFISAVWDAVQVFAGCAIIMIVDDPEPGYDPIGASQATLAPTCGDCGAKGSAFSRKLGQAREARSHLPSRLPPVAPGPARALVLSPLRRPWVWGFGHGRRNGMTQPMQGRIQSYERVEVVGAAIRFLQFSGEQICHCLLARHACVNYSICSSRGDH